MKALICADLHLNNSNYGKMEADGLSFRTKDFCKAFEKTVDRAVSKIDGIDTFIVLGDIFDNPHPPNNVREFFQAQMKRLSDAGIITHLLVGNHDACRHHHALQPIIGTEFPMVSVYYEPTIIEVPGVTILIHPHSARIERQEITFRESLIEFAKSSAKRVAEARGKGNDVILLGHFPMMGARMSDFMVNKDDSAIQLSDIEATGVDFAFLGDYHAAQVIGTDTKAMYVGSLERATFGDASSSKGYVIYDPSSPVDPKNWKVIFVKQDGRPFVDLTATASDLDKVLNEGSGKVDDAVVRITFCGTNEEYKEYCSKRQQIKEALNKAKHIIFETKIIDPNTDKMVEVIRNEIKDRGEMGMSDILEIIRIAAQAEKPDKADVDAIMLIVNEVMSEVKASKSVTASGKSGRIRLHGVKMHNFQRYGEEANAVEFDAGAIDFLGVLDSSGKLKASNKAKLFEKAKGYLSTIDPGKKRLMSIIGQIEGDDRESNGAGKSSILEAISYAFYEKLTREFVHKDSCKGISTTSVVRTEGDKTKSDCYVDVVFSSENELWLVRRGRKVGKSGDHKSVLSLVCLSSDDNQEGSASGHRKSSSEEALAQLVQMDYETFVNSVMFGQNEADRFITGTDKVKKDILAKVLGLTVLDDCLASIRERKKNLGKDVESFEAQIMALKSSCDPSEMASLVEREKSQDADGKAAEALIVKLKAELDEFKMKSPKSECDRIEAEIASKQAEISRINSESVSRLKLINEACESAKGRARKARSEAKGDEASRGVATSDLAYTQKAILAFNEAETKNILAMVEKAKEAKPKRQAERTELQQRLSDLSKQKGKLEGIIESITKPIEKFKFKLAAFAAGGKMTCPECESEVSREHIEKKVAEKESEKRSAEESLSGVRAELDKISANVAEVDKKLHNIDEYIAKEAPLTASVKDHQRRLEKVSEFQTKISELETREKTWLASAEAEDKIAETEAAKIIAAEDEVRSTVKPIFAACTKLSNELANAKEGLNSFTTKVNSLETSLLSARKCMEGIVSSLSSIRTRMEMIGKTKDKMTQIASDLDKKRLSLGHVMILDKIFGLDGIRTHMMRKYIPLLNSFIAEFLEVMSKGRIVVYVKMDDVSSEITLEISGSSANKAELVSKGEFTRIKLAVDLALGMLSLSKNDNAPDFVCLDEIFAPVDAAGKDLMFDVIDKLQNDFRMVIVISHDQSVKERIKDIIIVNKVNDISRIERQTLKKAV